MKPRVVLDTNVLLVSLSKRSPYHWIIQALGSGAYRLLISTSILLEILATSPHVDHIDTSFRWRLLTDPDDDNVDCATGGQADRLVTYDKHFDVLRDLDFPRVDVITPEAFRELLETRA